MTAEVDLRPLILAALLAGTAGWWSVLLWRRRQDRELHGTLLRALGVAGLMFLVLLSASVGLGLPVVAEVASVWLLTVPVVGVVVGAVIELRQSRERRALRRLAEAAGESGTAYRRRPRHPIVIGGLYAFAMAVLITITLLVMVLTSAPNWLANPVPVPGARSELPLWLVPPMVVGGCGFVHALVNDFRR